MTHLRPTILVPPGMSWSEQRWLACLMQLLLFLDHGEARYIDQFETYTCSLGIVAGGRN